MRALAPRERRLIAIALLVAALALVWLLVVRPVLVGFDARDEDRQGYLLNYARNERVIGAMRATRAAVRAQRATRGDFALDAPGAAFAADTLRERIAVAARLTRVSVGSVQETQGPPGAITVRADVTALPDRLAPFVAAIENGRPLVAVEQLVVNADAAAASGHAAPLAVRLDISARYDAPRVRAGG